MPIRWGFRQVPGFPGIPLRRVAVWRAQQMAADSLAAAFGQGKVWGLEHPTTEMDRNGLYSRDPYIGLL